jgi:CRISPR-associated endonuclease/helicase Cas3
MTEEYFAHSLPEHPPSQWQKLEDHLQSVADMARRFGGLFDAGEWACAAGRWHDLGKYSTAFQDRLKKANDPDAHIESVGNRPDHSTAGAQHAVRKLGPAGKLIAYAIAGHHAGLPDGRSNQKSCLEDRLEKTVPDVSACPDVIRNCPAPGKPPIQLRPKTRGFQAAFFVRMLFSCLTDADFLDTEAFLDPDRSRWRGGYPTLSELAQRLDLHLRALSENADDHPVNQRRADVLSACRNAAERSPGLFSLTVPTGGGKTLSSLAFALKHAIRHGMDRVIYVIPYTSIIEQTAAVFRAALGEAAVLEHHSNYDPPAEDRRSRLAAENWDAPVIVTTNVQFFESLFHNRSSRCRKLHRMARSVVILDEAQLLPTDLLRPCLEAVRELTLNYGTTAVLCTATQPALHRREDFPMGLEDVREIVADPEGLYQSLKRVRVHNLGPRTDAEVSELLRQSEQALCVVNTRKHARRLFEAIGPGAGHFHLSALMSPVHRAAKLGEIRERLKNGARCRVISTQLIEAGVDVDFPRVFRSAAGIDSIAQAAGRCNREGRLDWGEVWVFSPEEGLPTGAFRQNAQAGESVLARYADDPLQLSAVAEYFLTLYWRKGEAALDRLRIMERLEEDAGGLNFPFKEIAGEFRLIREETRPVIVPWNEAAGSVADPFGLIREIDGTDRAASLFRRFQRWTVTLYDREYKALEQAGSLRTAGPGGMFTILTNPEIYDDDLGLRAEAPARHDPAGLMA